jgi:hypothetical protein
VRLQVNDIADFSVNCHVRHLSSFGETLLASQVGYLTNKFICEGHNLVLCYLCAATLVMSHWTKGYGTFKLCHFSSTVKLMTSHCVTMTDKMK